jgi:gas vesicle protein
MKMNDTNTTSTGSVLAAFAIGALAGAGIALLYAPCSGKETRRIIGRRSRELTRKAGDALDDAKEAILGKRNQFVAAMKAGKDAVREELAK